MRTFVLINELVAVVLHCSDVALTLVGVCVRVGIIFCGNRFSGGRLSVKEHRELGADLEVDVAYNYLRFFLEDDDELEKITKGYGSGEMLTGEVKGKLIEVVSEIVRNHNEARGKVTREVIDRFMAVRSLEF